MVYILAQSVAALFTLASLEGLMSLQQVALILIGEPDAVLKRYLKEHPTLRILQGTNEPEALYRQIHEDGVTSGLVFCVGEGALVLKDLYQGLVNEELPATYGRTRKHMYAGRMNKDATYRMLRIKAKEDFSNTLMHFWMDRPWQEPPSIYPNGLVWSHDPLVDYCMRGADRMKHAWYGTQAHVLDYHDVACDPQATVDVCFSAPLEYYVPYAERLRPYLSEEVYQTILRNGKRSEFAQPLRRLMAPAHVYYSQLCPTL